MTAITTIKVPVDIDDTFIDDIVTTMFEGGSNYWVDHIKINQPKPQGLPTATWAATVLNTGEMVVIFPKEDDMGYRLTREKVIEGLQEWVDHTMNVPMITEDGKTTIDAGNIDADDADSILQYALFGKLVYG